MNPRRGEMFVEKSKDKALEAPQERHMRSHPEFISGSGFVQDLINKFRDAET